LRPIVQVTYPESLVGERVHGLHHHVGREPAPGLFTERVLVFPVPANAGTMRCDVGAWSRMATCSSVRRNLGGAPTGVMRAPFGALAARSRPHSGQQVVGGFKWSSQHLGCGGVGWA